MTKYIDPDSPQQLAEFIDSLDNVQSIKMNLNQFVRFKSAYQLGFKYNSPTYKDIPITIVAGNDNDIVSIECR